MGWSLQSEGARSLLQVPPQWQAVDFISDLHLSPALPRTRQAFAEFALHTRADALVILGDLFELWVGDDARHLPFERDCADLLRQAAQRVPVAFMVGNRDFLVGSSLLTDCGVLPLPDPCALQAWDQRALLSHGDAWCLADTDYQRFRQQVRSPAWQAEFLARGLAERQALAAAMRNESEARKRQLPRAELWADVDSATAVTQLRLHAASALVHGHTHRPQSEALAAGLVRHVLSDWDLDGPAPHAEVLRLRPGGFERLSPGAAAQ